MRISRLSNNASEDSCPSMINGSMRAWVFLLRSVQVVTISGKIDDEAPAMIILIMPGEIAADKRDTDCSGK